MSYTEVEFVQNVLQDDFLKYPANLVPFFEFAEAIINARLAGKYALPFDDTSLYPSVPVLIKWIASYLVGYKLYDKATATQDISSNRGEAWLAMAHDWLTKIAEGDYLLHLEDGTVVESAGSTTGPRAYPSGVRDKAPSADNTPLFTRAQAGEW